MLCSSCGRENAAEARFCDTCGAALVPPDDTAMRKTVTVVFTDLAGSTELGERLDPESLRQVVGRYFDTVRAVLERHGGTVEKFIGDAVMAVFGVPVVQEDDALRAVRAADELREALDRLNDALEREHGVRLVTRTGVNTGEVVVGGTGAAADQRLAVGDAVNVAARLEQAAAGGEVLVGAETYRAVRDAVAVEEVEPVAAKGKSDAVPAWRLVAVRPDVPAFTRPIATPFVGRRNELDALLRAFGASVAERSCTLATVVGTPGIGKSRLAREFVAAVEGDARVVIGRCVAYGRGITYLPLADIVREIAGDDPHPRLAELLADDERGAVAARLVAGAVGAGDDATSPEETAWAFRRVLEALAAHRPLVVVVDDIHWAEPELLDLLEYLPAFSSGSPILILCLARPDLFDMRASWAAPHPRSTIVALSPLDGPDAQHLVERLLDERHVPLTLRRRIVETAEGNPLFIEQVLAMLADDPHAADDAVPPTIQALLAARIDRLDPPERAVLQRGSVEGRLFHRGAVAELLGDRAAAGLGGTLLTLARKEFVRPDRSSFAGDDGFRFNHVLIRDVAYASLTKELRADLHVRLARRLGAHGTESPGHDEIVGHHLEQAHRFRTELGRSDADTRALAEEAGDRVAAAGRRALDRGEAATAASLLGRACALLEASPRKRAALLPELARARRDNGALDEAERAATEAVDAARRHGDELTEGRAEIEGMRTRFMRGALEPDAVRAVAHRAIAVFERAGTDADLADAWQLIGVAELAAGDRDAQLQALLRAREHASRPATCGARSTHGTRSAVRCSSVGRPSQTSSRSSTRSSPGRANAASPAVEADALLGGPYLLSRLGRFDEARRQLERSKAICRDLGSAYGLAEAHGAGAQMELLAGDAAAAEQELREGIDVLTTMGASRYVAVYRTRLAHVLVARGRDAEALEELEDARAINGSSPLWKAGRARLLARSGETEEAATLARDAALSVPRDDLTNRADILTHLAEVLRAAGDLDAARETLEEAATLHDLKGNVLPAQACRRLRDDARTVAKERS